jgi:hypothetical protein
MLQSRLAKNALFGQLDESIMFRGHSGIASNCLAVVSAKPASNFERFMREFLKTVSWHEGVPP